VEDEPATVTREPDAHLRPIVGVEVIELFRCRDNSIYSDVVIMPIQAPHEHEKWRTSRNNYRPSRKASRLSGAR